MLPVPCSAASWTLSLPLYVCAKPRGKAEKQQLGAISQLGLGVGRERRGLLSPLRPSWPSGSTYPSLGFLTAKARAVWRLQGERSLESVTPSAGPAAGAPNRCTQRELLFLERLHALPGQAGEVRLGKVCLFLGPHTPSPAAAATATPRIEMAQAQGLGRGPTGGALESAQVL